MVFETVELLDIIILDIILFKFDLFFHSLMLLNNVVKIIVGLGSELPSCFNDLLIYSNNISDTDISHLQYRHFNQYGTIPGTWRCGLKMYLNYKKKT